MKQTFRFFATMEQANTFIKARGTRRKHTITPWQNASGTEKKVIVWFYV